MLKRRKIQFYDTVKCNTKCIIGKSLFNKRLGVKFYYREVNDDQIWDNQQRQSIILNFEIFRKPIDMP